MGYVAAGYAITLTALGGYAAWVLLRLRRYRGAPGEEAR